MGFAAARMGGQLRQDYGGMLSDPQTTRGRVGHEEDPSGKIDDHRIRRTPQA
jgi:hypothetical protein